jgi:hypothetical protein
MADNNKPVLLPHFFTFGMGQGYDNCYVKINAINHMVAREAMHRHYGTCFCSQYDDEELFQKQLDRYSITMSEEITVNTTCHSDRRQALLERGYENYGGLLNG